MNQVVQTLKGFRDFLPQEKRARDFVALKIREVFERYGFEPLETPTLEYASLLLGKYGDEADKLIYSFEDRGGRRVGLRYDQTVPTARVLAQYRNELPQFFRRYQMQNVFRADKPQQGRFREFAQCDADIFGSTSPAADAEILACAFDAFQNVGFRNVKLLINDRKTLMDTLQPFATKSDEKNADGSTQAVTVFSIIQSIDKLDKMSSDDVQKELVEKGLSAKNAAAALQAISRATASESVQSIMQLAIALGVPKEALVFTPTLARGLDYYTGMIFEIRVSEYTAGSCGGGGRYDNLIEQLGGPSVPAVGFAFGFDRMVEAAKQLALVPSNAENKKCLVTIFDAESAAYSAMVASLLRKNGVQTELYPQIGDAVGKQLKYAAKNGYQFALIAGQAEQEKNTVQLKDIQKQSQREIPLNEVASIMYTE